jgi:hypothetical protein
MENCLKEYGELIKIIQALRDDFPDLNEKELIEVGLQLQRNGLLGDIEYSLQKISEQFEVE